MIIVRICLQIVQIFLALTILSSVQGSASNQFTSTLASQRKFVRFPKYTAAEKVLVAEQAKLLLTDFYVHQEVKRERYGVDADAKSRIAKIVAQAHEMPDEQFHTEILKIFLDLRDLHTNYSFPEPYACFTAYLPFQFLEIKDARGDRKIVVSKITQGESDSKIRFEEAKVQQFFEQIALGDALVTFDGIEIWKILDSHADLGVRNIGGGTATDPALSHALDKLTIRNGRWEPLPVNDKVTLEFRRGNGELQKVEFPWLVKTKPTCDAEGSSFEFSDTTASRSLRGSKRSSVKMQRENRPFIERAVLKKDLRLHSDRIKGLELIESNEPTLSYGTLKNSDGVFGYIRYLSFTPEVLTAEQTIAEFRRILLELKDTKGLIIDVRDNGGGDGSISDSLAQLLSPSEIKVTDRRIWNSNNQRFFVGNARGFKYSEERKALNQSAGNYSGIIAGDSEYANRLGQVYFGPVALLTNGNCFSACDYFAASVKDFGVATVFGENSWQTGGGGADVWDHSFFLEQLASVSGGPFEELPGRQEMRVAYAQALRHGRNTGRLIEDSGVQVDRVLQKSLGDILNGDIDLIKKVTQKLVSDPRFRVHSSMTLEFLDEIDSPKASTLKIQALLVGTDKVEVFINGKKVATQAASASSENRLELEVPVGDLEVGGYSLVLKGYQGNTVRSRLVRTLRIVPEYFSIAESESLDIKFQDSSAAPLAFFTFNHNKASEWTVKKGRLSSQKAENYTSNVHTVASLFLDLKNKNKLTLEFDAEVQTEYNYDFFWIEAREEGGEFSKIAMNLNSPVTVIDPVNLQDMQTTNAETLSGLIGVRHVSADLSHFAGKKVEIRFVFQSDGEFGEKGVWIDNIKAN